MTSLPTPRFRLRGALGLGLGLALSLTAASRPAVAADPDELKKEAQQHFDAAIKLAKGNDYQAALAEFRLAYGKFPSYRVLYNIAQLCARTEDPVCAHRSYTKYLRDGGADVPQQRRTATEAELERLGKKVGLVTVTSAEAGARVRLDDEPLGETPLPDAIAVSPGEHRFLATFGAKSAERRVTLAAGEALALTLDPPADEPAPKPAAPVGTQGPGDEIGPKQQRPSRKVPWVPWAVAGGFAVGTGVFAFLTASAASDYQDRKDAFPVSRGELDDAQSKARTMFFVTGALGAATVVAAGVAGYFTWVAPRKAAIVVGPGTIGAVGVF